VNLFDKQLLLHFIAFLKDNNGENNKLLDRLGNLEVFEGRCAKKRNKLKGRGVSTLSLQQRKPRRNLLALSSP
jgi:hypothetical protein